MKRRRFSVLYIDDNPESLLAKLKRETSRFASLEIFCAKTSSLTEARNVHTDAMVKLNNNLARQSFLKQMDVLILDIGLPNATFEDKDYPVTLGSVKGH